MPFNGHSLSQHLFTLLQCMLSGHSTCMSRYMSRISRLWPTCVHHSLRSRKKKTFGPGSKIKAILLTKNANCISTWNVISYYIYFFYPGPNRIYIIIYILHTHIYIYNGLCTLNNVYMHASGCLWEQVVLGSSSLCIPIMGKHMVMVFIVC